MVLLPFAWFLLGVPLLLLAFLAFPLLLLAFRLFFIVFACFSIAFPLLVFFLASVCFPVLFHCFCFRSILFLNAFDASPCFSLILFVLFLLLYIVFLFFVFFVFVCFCTFSCALAVIDNYIKSAIAFQTNKNQPSMRFLSSIQNACGRHGLFFRQ